MNVNTLQSQRVHDILLTRSTRRRDDDRFENVKSCSLVHFK